MSAFPNGDWHTANGAGLPFRRPPTVDEALPYSPFTSIVPFSPDVIPFPFNEPPTPPTTLTPEQQTAGKRALGILNNEIHGPPSTAHHLERTLRDLRNLMGDPREMTEFRFKPTTQLATPPDSPTKPTEESTPTSRPRLSPFANMLLKQTEVHYQPAGAPAPQRPKAKPEPPRPHASTAPPRHQSQQVTPSQNSTPYAQNSALVYPSSIPAPSSASSEPRSGPAVVIKPPSAPKHEYRLIEKLSSPPDEAQPPNLDYLATLRPEEQEVAKQKIHRLQKLVRKYCEAKDEVDSELFEKISTLDMDITVMTSDALRMLYDRVMLVNATKCFSSVPVETIIEIQSLCDPLITTADQSSLFPEGELDSWTGDIRIVEAGLKAARLALTAMIKGPHDRRTSSEDLLITVVQVLKRVLEACIFPVVVASRRDPDTSLFTYASNQKQELLSILRLCTAVEELLAQTVRKTALPDTALNAIMFLAHNLLMQPNSESEKDSVLGIPQFEKLRRASMDALANIFACRPEHQKYIIHEILTSLEKLPDKGPSSRQFKSAKEDPIMAVSASFMQFVQVAATKTHDQRNKTSATTEEEDSSSAEDESDTDRPRARKVKTAKSNPSADVTARQLMANARRQAQFIANTLIEKGRDVPKTGENPHGRLLDMFVEDFCKVLGSPEWPAADLLLYALLAGVLKLSEDASTRNMASTRKLVNTMCGHMGCGIIEFKKRIRQLRHDLDMSQSGLSNNLHQLTGQMLEEGDTRFEKSDVLARKDLFQMLIESLPDYLKMNDDPEDLHLMSVRGCYISCWMDSIDQAIVKNVDGAADDPVVVELQKSVQLLVLEPKRSSREYKYQNISEMQSRLAAGLTTLKSPFCQFYDNIVKSMFNQAQTGTTQQKSDAIRNIGLFLARDPRAIPDKEIYKLANLLKDASPAVRARALDVIADRVHSNPELERLCLDNIQRLTTDNSIDPKRKAINLLKAIYAGSNSLETKTKIVTALLPASQDYEKSVADNARQALEEVWLKVLGKHTNDDESRIKLQRVERVSLLAQTVWKVHIDRSMESIQAFEKFFAKALAKSGPNTAVNFQTCKDMVADLVEGVISPDSVGAGYTQQSGLLTLSILARVSPMMFTLDQIQRLKLYIIDIKTGEDIEILRSTVTIFRFVIPRLSDLPSTFADDVWKLLTQAISKLANSAADGRMASKTTLMGAAHCLWIMRHVATNGVVRFLATPCSLVVQLLQAVDAPELPKERIVKSWLLILGTYGKICDWSEVVDLFHASIADRVKAIAKKPGAEKNIKHVLDFAGREPSLILLEAAKPFTKQTLDLPIRETAYSAVGEICQGSPDLFQRRDVETTFKLVFKNDIPSLKQVVLAQFHDFFVKSESRSDEDPVAVDEDAPSANGRLGITFQAGEGQVTINYLARKFLPEIINVALHSQGELSLVATRTIASISKQGLMRPKDVGPALVALGTSPDPLISGVAAQEHKQIHIKYESMFEKEYMAAINMAFQYQYDVFEDPHGMTKPPDCKPKIAHVFAVMLEGIRKTLKRFLESFMKHIDFKFSKLENSTDSFEALYFTRFCLENIALFDVAKVEDVSIITTALESIVLKDTGPSVGVVIETEMPKTTPAPKPPQLVPDAPGEPTGSDVAMQDAAPDHLASLPDKRLKQISRACTILRMMWETRCHIRKAYNIKPGRILQKDFQEKAVRNHLIKGATLYEGFEKMSASLETRQSMIANCYDFADFLERDREHEVGGEVGEEENGAGYATPEEGEEESQPVVTSGRGRKRKTSAGLGNTPRKARGRPPGARNKGRKSKTPEGDDWD